MKSEGTTILQALQNLNLEWVQVKGKGVLTVKKGRKSLELSFPMFTLRKIISSKIVMSYWARNLDFLLKSSK